MSDIIPFLPNLALAYFAYLVATVSPGPANLAVIATSMRTGRRAGLLMAAGIMIGSLIWGLLTAFGLSAILATYAGLAEAVRVAGGLYLLWLAARAARSACRRSTGCHAPAPNRKAGLQYAAGGLAIHLTNPKSILAWLAIIAIASVPGAPSWMGLAVVAGCWISGVLFYGTCALAFSTRRMAEAYRSLRRWIEGTTAAIFGAAGIKLLLLER